MYSVCRRCRHRSRCWRRSSVDITGVECVECVERCAGWARLEGMAIDLQLGKVGISRHGLANGLALVDEARGTIEIVVHGSALRRRWSDRQRLGGVCKALHLVCRKATDMATVGSGIADGATTAAPAREAAVAPFFLLVPVFLFSRLSANSVTSMMVHIGGGRIRLGVGVVLYGGIGDGRRVGLGPARAGASTRAILRGVVLVGGHGGRRRRWRRKRNGGGGRGRSPHRGKSRGGGLEAVRSRGSRRRQERSR